MTTIPRYTKTVIRERAVPSLVDPGAITAPGAFGIVSDIAAIGQEFVRREKDALDATWLNEQMISGQRKLLDLSVQRRQENLSNPQNFAINFDDEAQKFKSDIAKLAPSKEARDAYTKSFDRVLLSTYEQNLNWQRKRSIGLMGERITNAANDINVLALNAGRDGLPIKPLFRQIDTTSGAASTILPVEDIPDEEMRTNMVTSYLTGMLETNPEGVQEILESGEFDNILGADGIVKFTEAAEQTIEDREKKVISDFNKAFEVAETQRLMQMSAENKTLSTKRINKTLTYADVVQWETNSLTQATTDQEKAKIKEFADFMREDLIVPEDVEIQTGAEKQVRNARIKKLADELIRKAGLPVGGVKTRAERVAAGVESAIVRAEIDKELTRLGISKEGKTFDEKVAALVESGRVSAAAKKKLVDLGIGKPTTVVTNTSKALVYKGLVNRLVELGAATDDDGSITGFNLKKQNLEQLLDVQLDILKAGQSKLLSEVDVNNLFEAVMPGIEAQIDDKDLVGSKRFFEGGRFFFDSQSTEPYAPAFSQVLDHLKKTPAKDTPLNQATILQMALSEMRARNILQIQDPQLRVDKFNEAVKAAKTAFDESRNPVLSILPGTPNSIVGTLGKEFISGGKSDLKPDVTINIPGTLMRDANGNLAVVFPDGKHEEITEEEARRRGLL